MGNSDKTNLIPAVIAFIIFIIIFVVIAYFLSTGKKFKENLEQNQSNFITDNFITGTLDHYYNKLEKNKFYCKKKAYKRFNHWRPAAEYCLKHPNCVAFDTRGYVFDYIPNEVLTSKENYIQTYIKK